MRKISNKKNTGAIALILLLMAPVTLMANDLVKAQAELEVDTTAFLSFRPNPVGVNQPILVNMWVNPPLHVSRHLSNYTVTITDPDGNEDVRTMDSYYGDGTAWFEYVVDQVGTWKLKFEFPGEHLPEADVPGGWNEPPIVHIGACYYKPASTEEQTLVVQQEPVPSWPESPLPTDYWTRPISPENREWWSIAGNYPWTSKGGEGFPGWPADTNAYASNYEFTPWVQAPNTAHIVWKRQTSIEGLIGGSMYHASLGTMSMGGGTPGTIYAGRCYQSITKPGGESALQCYDLRTGEVYWEISPSPVPMISFLGIFFMAGTLQLTYEAPSPETPGATARADMNVELVVIGDRLVKIDPWDGTVTMNVTGMSGTLYNDPYVLSVQNTNPYYPYFGPPPQYYLINWTIERNAGPLVYTAGGMQPITTNFTERIKNNVTWPLGGYFTTVYDYEAGMAAAVNVLSPPEMRSWYGTNILAASLKTGDLLWNITVDETSYSPMCTVADHGKVAVLMMDGTWMAWYLNNGTLAWKSDQMDYPWAAAGWGAYAAQSAYGLLYREAYDGVYAFNWTNGKIAWKYKAPTPVEYETPFVDENGKGVYPFNAGGILADGKLFTYNTEHTPTSPVTRGWRLHCINATTGEGIWNITGSMDPGPIADGYLTAGNVYDGYMYVFGKGKSATTVTASPKVSVHNSSVLIEGTVLDMSPAQPDTPCVSKESMTEWMEYLHMQKPIPADVTGVPVSLDTVDPNGNFVHIGDATTDMSGTFGCMWTPEAPGEYRVMATFMGDDSYGSSWAETHVGVVEAPEAPPEPEPEEEPAYTAIDLAIIAAVVVAIIIGIVNLWALRKRT